MDQSEPYSKTRRVIRRLEWITQALESGINCTDIAAKFDVSPKTAQRDINFLRETVRIGYDAKTRKFYLEER